MKPTLCLMASMLILTGYAFADNRNPYMCLEFTESTVTIALDPECKILQHPARKHQYPDVQFLAEQEGQPVLPACVKAQARGKLGSSQFTANSVSGVIAYSDPLFLSTGETRLPFTAATILNFQFAQYQAELYLRDASQLINPFTAMDGNAIEELYVIGGSKIFNGAKGTIKITGPEFIAANVTGTVCIKGYRGLFER